MTNKIVVFSTCASPEEAGRLARSLVEARLAACVSVIPQIQSYYRWKGSIEQSDECLLMIKSSRDLYRELERKLAAAHSYEIPEVIALPVVEGSAGYLAWLGSELGEGAE